MVHGHVQVQVWARSMCVCVYVCGGWRWLGDVGCVLFCLSALGIPSLPHVPLARLCVCVCVCVCACAPIFFSCCVAGGSGDSPPPVPPCATFCAAALASRAGCRTSLASATWATGRHT